MAALDKLWAKLRAKLHTEIFPAVSWATLPRVGAQMGSASQTRGKKLGGEAECTAPVLMRCGPNAPVGRRALLTSAGMRFSLLTHTGENIQKGSPDFIASADIWGHNLLHWREKGDFANVLNF